MGNVDFDIIHTIRNPLSAISSPVNNWLRYNSGKDFFAKGEKKVVTSSRNIIQDLRMLSILKGNGENR